ncbi:response regulator/GGDEF domain protein [Myxococcus xanthus DK 1622]|uniref:Response regulator/GGDEF domain protein n=1 Tax=Myxococcus xanthus (strain DK1622) TaxID=246197 RepID=Q1CVV3_MYXXD|nr:MULTISPECIES: response regulator [Myxococcus]ABF91599.1 response regulator/GGDEF domain protein [Myxococcus xanthus DK 1622]NOJ54868.1 response regulator [Myxococcus xanthus]QPM79605.1 response regulator [Myxococcus xanthus]QVW68685.1 response regulator [Myxococcus xanthus DZ2]QZZ54959.1 Regulator of RpoS [Myxococcus xanthus]
MSSRTLLFLEDDKDLQSLVGTFLREKGYRVEPARSAAEAQAVLARVPVDAAIVDGLLPGMTGADFIRELRKTQPKLPILFASAFWKDLKSHELLTRQLGVVRIIHKPYKPEELLVWVNQLFPAPALPPPPPPEALEEAEEVNVEVDDLAASLAALNAEYGARLKEKVAALEALLVRGRGGDAAALEEAYTVVHKLHGTAGSYGFAEVSIRAGQLEAVLLPARAGAPVDVAALDASFRTLAAAASVPVKPAAAPPQSSEGVLLVVDEDAKLLAEAERMGRQVGVGVVTARTADAACEVARRQWVDGVLVHLDLGGPLGGLAVAHALRAEESLPVLPLAVTGARDVLEERVAAAHAGASLFLPRPFTARDFSAAAERMVAARRPERARVMVVDDDPDAIAALTQALASDQIEVVGLSDAHGLMEALAQHRPDLLLLDVQMPGPSGFDLCRILRSTPEWQELPVLLITAHLGLEFRLAAFQAGADDYLSKPVLREELRARVQARLERTRLSRERAERDGLTGLLLRRPFLDGLRARLAESRRQGKPLALCFLDVDHFKQVNDRYGHLAGDRVLMWLGRLLGARFRREDVRGRWGGEEFVVGLLGESAGSASEILARTAAELSDMTFDGDTGEPFHVTFSAGIAVSPGDGDTVESLLRTADARLLRAKENGRNRIEA